MNEANNLQNSTEQAVNYTDLLATGLSDIQIVRKKYPKAWSQKHNGIYSIYTGQDKDPKDVPYRPNWATPHGWKIGEGNKLKQAWQNAAQACC